MFLQRLDLRNFRNFEQQNVEFPEGGAALIGDNGQGKTNLLEAVYYLELFRSFRGARDEQLITFGRDYFRVEGDLAGGERGEEVTVAAGYAREGRRKKVTVDGSEPERLGDAIGRVGAIVFTASDVEIVAGGPGARRRFLDIILSLVQPGYLAALQRYRQIVSQRNELLRDGARPNELGAWNTGLVEYGSEVTQRRASWVAARRAAFARYYSAISGGQAGDVEYAPSIAVPDTDEARGATRREAWVTAFRQELDRVRQRELRRGLSVVGPHRDELKFWGLDAGERVELRSFGSAGQQRTAAIALRLVEAEALREALGRQPIVLLDDVFAELDPQRAERLAQQVLAESWGQVLVTSPKPNEFALLGGGLDEYRIASGMVTRA